MDIHQASIFATVVIAHFLALLSPGPDFVLVVRSAMRNDRKQAVGVAAGIASANAVYIILCLIGVGSILASSVPVMIALKIIGGLFLSYLAIQALRAKASDYANLALSDADATSTHTTTWLREYSTGFMSGILNPKNLLFYLSLFTVVLTKDVSLQFKVALGVWMTLLVFFWDAAIIFLLSTKRVRKKFTRIAYYVDKLTGAILGMIGYSILRSALTKQI